MVLVLVPGPEQQLQLLVHVSIAVSYPLLLHTLNVHYVT